MRRIFVDMDGVLAVWQNNVPLEEVTAAGYFRQLPAVKNVINAINLLTKQQNFETYILSSVFNDDHSIQEKEEWLDSQNVQIDKKHRLFVPYGKVKSEFVAEQIGLLEDDILIDDFSHNLREWHGIGIKMLNGINGTKGTWRGYVVRNNMPSEILEKQLRGIILAA